MSNYCPSCADRLKSPSFRSGKADGPVFCASGADCPNAIEIRDIEGRQTVQVVGALLSLCSTPKAYNAIRSTPGDLGRWLRLQAVEEGQDVGWVPVDSIPTPAWAGDAARALRDAGVDPAFGVLQCLAEHGSIKLTHLGEDAYRRWRHLAIDVSKSCPEVRYMTAFRVLALEMTSPLWQSIRHDEPAEHINNAGRVLSWAVENFVTLRHCYGLG